MFVIIRKMDRQFNLVTVGLVYGELIAHAVKIRFESEGIPVIIGCEPYFNLNLGVFAPFSVAVPPKYAGYAKELIDTFECNYLKTLSRVRLWTIILFFFI